MRKTLILASLMLLLLGMAPGYRGSEGVTNKPPAQMRNLIRMELRIDRTGKTNLYAKSLVRDTWGSEGFVIPYFEIPEGKKIFQHPGWGAGTRVIVNEVPGERCTAGIFYKVEYKVLWYRKYYTVFSPAEIKLLGLPNKRVLGGWNVRIQETWKNGKAYGKCMGIYGNVGATIGVGNQIIDTYTVKVPLYPTRASKTSYVQNSIIKWQNNFSARLISIR